MRPRVVLLACGVLYPLLYILGDVLAAALYDGYSYIHQTISELNAFGAPSRPLTLAFGFAGYPLMVVFGAGLWRWADRPRLRAAGVVLAFLGLFSILAVPLASMQMRGVEQGRAGALHIASGAVAIPLLLTAIGLTASTLGRRFAVYSALTVAVLLGFGIWAGLEGDRVAAGLDTPWLGVKERISVYSYQLWLIALAVAVFGRETAPAGLRADAPGPPPALRTATGSRSGSG